MLPNAVVELVHEACGEALLLDARNSRALLSGVDGEQLYAILRRLSNYGFTRFVDFTGIHLGGEEFSLLLTIRAPEHGHAGLTLKWNWPPKETDLVARDSVPANGVGQQTAGAESRPTSEGEEEPPPPVDPDLAGLGIAVHQIGPQPDSSGGVPPPDDGRRDAAPTSDVTDDDGGQGRPPHSQSPVAHPSLTAIWPGAGLMEREMFELLGLPFKGNHNLDPLLIDAQFPGHPLRRDYELPKRKSYAETLLKEREEAALLGLMKQEQFSSGGVSPPNDDGRRDAAPTTGHGDDHGGAQ